jgi:Sulfatase
MPASWRQAKAIMETIRAEAPNTIVIITADNGAWQDAYPDGGTVPFRGEKGSPFEGGFRVPGIMWWPGKIPAGARYGEMMSHIDCWATLATMVGLTPPPHGEWKDNDGKPIYFDSIDNSAYILGKERHSERNGWIYIDGESFAGARADVGGDPKTRISKSPGNTCTRLKTPGSAQSKISGVADRRTT